MDTKFIGVMVIGVIVVGGASFWGGITYAKSATPARGGLTAGGATFAGRQGGAARFGGGDGGVFGTVVAKDATSITVQLGGPDATSTNGASTGSKIVLISTGTQVGKFVSGTASDLSVGQAVMVAGTPNSDGSVTAQSIQIRPAGMGTRTRAQ